uniref:Uncharacterized protein n=1 Tax=Geospiza parvula TaxID=87175 RepID=A0A8C3MQB2_GEOPR
MAQGGLPDLLLPPGEDPPGPPNSGTPQELGAHPGLAQLLQSLGGLLGGDGLSPPLQLQLRQAEVSLGRARALWLHLELLWRLLGELIREPRELEPDVLQLLEQALTQAQLRRGPPEIAGLLPPRKPPQLLPRLLPELQRRLKEKREQLQEFLLGSPKIPQIHPKNPPNPEMHQNHPKSTENVPKNPENPPKMPQNPSKIVENPPQISPIPPKISEIPPKIPQNPPTIPPKNPENLPEMPQMPQNPPKIIANPPKIAQIPPKIPQIPPKIAQNPPEPPPENPPQTPQNFTEMPQIPPRNPRNFPEFPPNFPELPGNAGIPPKMAQSGRDLGAWLGAERERLRRERLRQRRLREEAEKLRWKYPQVLQRCVSLLSQLRLQGALQAGLDGGRGRYLLAKGGAVLLKSRLEELQILLDTYPAPTIEAHRRIRAGLAEARRDAEAEAAILRAELAALRGLGPEFRALALELGRIRQELAQKGWALRQLRPPQP